MDINEYFPFGIVLIVAIVALFMVTSFEQPSAVHVGQAGEAQRQQLIKDLDEALAQPTPEERRLMEALDEALKKPEPYEIEILDVVPPESEEWDCLMLTEEDKRQCEILRGAYHYLEPRYPQFFNDQTPPHMSLRRSILQYRQESGEPNAFSEALIILSR